MFLYPTCIDGCEFGSLVAVASVCQRNDAKKGFRDKIEYFLRIENLKISIKETLKKYQNLNLIPEAFST